MSEYVVRWRHWRCAHSLDFYVRMAKRHAFSMEYAKPRRMNSWYIRPNHGEPVSQYGGKTECHIYQLCPPLHEATQMPTMKLEVASAEAICSWRDQFDRRVGRLYSLALALHEWDSCAASALVKTQILTDNIPQAGERGNAFYLAFLAHDQVAVKRICAEIVQSWKQR